MPENPITHPMTDDRHRLNIGRDQILNRLWELASLDPEVTRGSMAGQIKAIAMIVAIEGLIPSRHQRQHQVRGAQPADAMTAVKPQPTAPHVPEPEPPSNAANDALNRVLDAIGHTYDTVVNTNHSLRLPTSLQTNSFPRGRQTP